MADIDRSILLTIKNNIFVIVEFAFIFEQVEDIDSIENSIHDTRCRCIIFKNLKIMKIKKINGWYLKF